MINYFILEDSPYYLGHKTIRINDSKFNIGSTSGSRNVLMARLMNLSWGQFLRLCRDVYDAELVGKNSMYIIPYFSSSTDGGKKLCKELNERLEKILKDKGEKNNET